MAAKNFGASRRVNLISGNVPAAGTVLGTPVVGLAAAKFLEVQANLTYTSGGTTIDCYVQTSLDGGTTWVDIMNFHFLLASAIKISAVALSTALAAAVTPTDGSIAANTILSGLLGDQIRLKTVIVGTYVGTLRVDAVVKG